MTLTKRDFNKRSAVPDPRGNGLFKLRVFARQAQKGRMARLLLKCGCCDESLTICYDDESLEIGGVSASREEWRSLLLPFLDDSLAE